MDVYVETNFVLELALLQEQQESCQKLLDLAEAGRINLILPAFSLTEPYETLIRTNLNCDDKTCNLLYNLVKVDIILKEIDYDSYHSQLKPHYPTD